MKDLYMSNIQFTKTTGIPNLTKQPVLDPNLSTAISTISGVVMYICIAAALIVILIKGVQFMSAAPEAKAEIKKQMIAITIGATMIFSIVAILRLIADITAGLFN